MVRISDYKLIGDVVLVQVVVGTGEFGVCGIVKSDRRRAEAAIGFGDVAWLGIFNIACYNKKISIKN